VGIIVIVLLKSYRCCVKVGVGAVGTEIGVVLPSYFRYPRIRTKDGTIRERRADGPRRMHVYVSRERFLCDVVIVIEEYRNIGIEDMLESIARNSLTSCNAEVSLA